MLEIDGSEGEGGGQILRTALALSLITGQPFRLTRIRPNRRRPGLQPQHLMSVIAAARVGHARVVGAEREATELEFEPGEVVGGHYEFPLKTAGSSSLILQTVLPPLVIADGPSRVIITGGTYNAFAPSFDFLRSTFLPWLEALGPRIELSLDRPGFYPRGGGRITAQIHPAADLSRLELMHRGELQSIRVRALVSGLNVSIAERECRRIAQLSDLGPECFEAVELDPRIGPGNVVLIELRFAGMIHVVSVAGEKGKPAEMVAAEAWQEAVQYLSTPAPVGEHLADQLLLPLAIGAVCSGTGGKFRCGPLSPHATTSMALIKRFLPVRFEVTPDESTGTLIVEVTRGTASG